MGAASVGAAYGAYGIKVAIALALKAAISCALDKIHIISPKRYYTQNSVLYTEYVMIARKSACGQFFL